MNTINVDDFAALNDEIRALTRAGVSLPAGLRLAAAEYSGSLAQTTTSIADRLERGEPLGDSLVSECGLPPAYAAVVAAGARSGRLSAALEGVASSCRRIADLRRLILVSLVYPGFLVVMAYGLFVFLLYDPDRVLTPDVYKAMGLGESPYAFYRSLQATLLYWVAWPPLIFVGLLTGVIWNLGRGGWGSRLGGDWGVAGFIQLGRVAAFLDLLSLLIEADTPLDEAVELASGASNEASIRSAGSRLADLVRSGSRGENLVIPRDNIPPMIQWLVLCGVERDRLLRCLRRSSQAFRRRTERAGSWMSLYIPIVFAGVIGGGATVGLGLFVLAPWFHLLLRLGASL